MTNWPNNIDELLKARAEIDSALRQHKEFVSNLFTDVVGSTAYSDHYGDTTGMAMLYPHAELATSVVEEFHGTVIKTIGDSVMASFAEPGHAMQAARGYDGKPTFPVYQTCEGGLSEREGISRV